MTHEQNAIFNKATECLHTFNACIESATTVQWPQEQLDRFNLWAAHGGIFGNYDSRTSMDWRLHARPDLVKMMLLLLELLQDYLSRISAVRGTIPEAPASTEEPSTQPMAVSPTTSPAQSTDSSECSIVIPPAGPSIVLSDPIEVAKRGAEDTITKLFRLSAIIRSAGMSYRWQKADNYVEKENGVDITQKFRDGIKLLLKYKRPPLKEFISKRLLESICLRQRRIAYSLRHKLIPSTDPSQVFKTPEHVAAKVVLQALGTIDDSLDTLPPPPAAPGKSKEFVCPFCAIPLEKASYQDSSWRSHVLKDIQPYVCILPNCKTPYSLYANGDSWINHMCTGHTITKWKCSNTSHIKPLIFDTEAQFSAHTESTHEELTGEEVLELATLSSFQVPREPEAMVWPECPICTVSLDGFDFLSACCHIAQDLLNFAFYSLPEGTELENSQSLQLSDRLSSSSDGAIGRRRQSEAETDEAYPWSLWDADNSPETEKDIQAYQGDLRTPLSVPLEHSQQIDQIWETIRNKHVQRMETQPDNILTHLRNMAWDEASKVERRIPSPTTFGGAGTSNSQGNLGVGRDINFVTSHNIPPQPDTATDTSQIPRNGNAEWWVVVLTTTKRGIMEYDVRVKEDTGTPVNWIHPNVVKNCKLDPLVEARPPRSFVDMNGKRFKCERCVRITWCGRGKNSYMGDFFISPEKAPIDMLLGDEFVTRHGRVRDICANSPKSADARMFVARRQTEEQERQMEEDQFEVLKLGEDQTPGEAAEGTVLHTIEVAVERRLRLHPDISLKDLYDSVKDFDIVRDKGYDVCEIFLDECIRHYRLAQDGSHGGPSTVASTARSDSGSQTPSRNDLRPTPATSTTGGQPSTLALNDSTSAIEIILPNDGAQAVVSTLRDGERSYISQSIVDRCKLIYHDVSKRGERKVLINLRWRIVVQGRGRSFRIRNCLFLVNDGLKTDLAIGSRVREQLEDQAGSTEDSYDLESSSEDEGTALRDRVLRHQY
ncbi:hypothetical protein G7054_g3545 [Neopestalotiopsis clavispora]|nr:hypothetical protein G7054_g3545 [Neopestalotiopsis clavispora]